MKLYHRSLDQFVEVLDQVPADGWDAATACEEWTARELVGHTIWGMKRTRALVLGEEPPPMKYGPGGESPGWYAGDDPPGAWRTARADADGVLSEEALTIEFPSSASPSGTMSIRDFLGILTLDNTVHAWDLGAPRGMTVRWDEDLLGFAQRFIEKFAGVLGRPGFFASPLEAPADADPQTRALAALGRRAW